MRGLMAIGLAIVLAPITALVTAKSMSKLWEWFVFRDYGPSPSMATWYGLSAIFSLAIAPLIQNITKEKSKETDPLLAVLGHNIGMWVGIGAVLCISWIVGFALHWV